MGKYQVEPVGYIRSEVTKRDDAPRQGRDVSAEAVIEILPRYTDALEGIGQWSGLLVVCWMHLANRETLTVYPRGDVRSQLTGVFSTRSPARPNPITVYTVELLAVDGNCLTVTGIDAVDGTPVVDIKPHVKRLDD